MMRAPLLLGAGLLSALLLVGGCVLRPEGAADEGRALEYAGRPFEKPLEQRQLPELPAEPAWQDVVRRAMLANGDLEAAYFEWAAAFHRVDMAATWPNTNLSLSFEYMIDTPDPMADRWNRTSIAASPDAMANLELPFKTAKSGEVAFEQARAAGKKFLAKKYEVRRQVLQGWLDYALMAEMARIQRDNVALLKMLAETAGNRVQAGAPQQDLLKSQIEHRLAENELAKTESQLAGMRAMLNGMLARPADAALAAPAALPEPRKVQADDAKLIAAAVSQNPELDALARVVASRENALELARMKFIPDINPVGGLTGSMEKFLGAMVALPTTWPMIQAGVREAEAMLRADQAMARQVRSERGASFVAALVAMRNAERQVALFRDTIAPKAEQALDSSRQAYAAGQVSFVELIDSQRTLLEIRRMIAEARVEREKRLAEIEALAGVDAESIGTPPLGPDTAQPGGPPLQRWGIDSSPPRE